MNVIHVLVTGVIKNSIGESITHACNWCHKYLDYNSFLVYCRELAPGTVSLTGDRARATTVTNIKIPFIIKYKGM